MAGVTFDSPDMNTLIADLGQVAGRVQAKASTALRKTAADIEADSKAITPVDTGNLRASISTTVSWDGDGIEAEIGPTAFYGIFVENGTSRMAPRAFMGPAFDRRSPEFATALEQIASEVL